MSATEVELEIRRITIHSWFVLTALSLLSAEEAISLKFRDSTLDPQNHPYVMRLHVRRPPRYRRFVVDIDLADAPSGRLTDADETLVRSATGEYGRPLGLVAGYRPPPGSQLRYVGHRLTRSSSASEFRRALAEWRSGLQFQSIADIEKLRSVDKRPVILLQTRAWSMNSASSQDRIKINRDRAELVRRLRREFGSRFVGGLVSDEFSRRQYPDLLTYEGTTSKAYSKLIASSAITISTVGLHGSNPWKLSEYLAAGTCIVSEPLSYEIPDPLDDAAIVFRSLDECVETCGRLLDDADELKERQSAALAYWNSFARPDRLLWRRLSEILDDAT